MNLAVFGKLLIGLGAFGIALVGLVFWLAGQAGLIRLPGDIVWRSGRSVLYFPIVTSIVVSLLLSLILNLIAHMRK